MPQVLDRKRVILISEHVDYGFYLKRRFEQGGFVLDVYRNVSDALNSITALAASDVDTRPWLLILDGSLYAIRGGQVTSKFFDNCGQIPVIVVNCAEADPEWGLEWKKLGVSLILSTMPADQNIAKLLFNISQVYWKRRT